jgi:hypothetical protein
MISKPNELKPKERRAFLQEERLCQSEQRVVDEELRHAATSAKTAKLRKLREARDAAESQASPTAAPPKPKAGAKTRTLRPGVRLRK